MTGQIVVTVSLAYRLSCWLNPLACAVLLVASALHWRRSKGWPSACFVVACLLWLGGWALRHLIPEMSEPGTLEMAQLLLEATRHLRVASVCLTMLAMLLAGIGGAFAILSLVRTRGAAERAARADSAGPARSPQ